MKIVVLEPLGVAEDKVRSAFAPLVEAGHELKVAEQKFASPEQKIEFAQGAEILVVANSPLEEEVIQGLEKLRLICVAFTGVDHVPLKLCAERGIALANAQGYATDATAELALALMLAGLRRIPAQAEAARKGLPRATSRGNLLSGKTVGIVGTGDIGLRLAELLQPFRCRIIAYSRTEKDRARDLGIEYVSMAKLLAESDLVSLHLPLNDQTKGLLGQAEFEQMKQSAILINCARGGVVDREDLSQALERGEIAAAYLDVLESEPPFDLKDPLLSTKNVFLTPHIGFLTDEAMEIRLEIVVSKARNWLAGDLEGFILK